MRENDFKQRVKSVGLRYLGGHVEHHGYNRRVLVSVDDEAHLLKLPAEIHCVLCQLMHTVTAWGGSEEKF